MALGLANLWKIWKYGEDDSFATFSARLNKLSDSVTAALQAAGIPSAGSDADRNALFPAPATNNRCWRTDHAYLERYDGTSWKPWESDWITYTPALTGITLGNGTSTWAYRWLGGEVEVDGGITLGSTSSMPGPGLTVALPVTRRALKHNYEEVLGSATLFAHAGTPYVVGVAADSASVTAVRIYPSNSGAVTTAIASTVPFTWAAADGVSAHFMFRPA